jgi:DNA repair exonuclease SbcCD ATPase subunit
MPAEEYQQLVEFLGRQFTKIDQQFARVDQQFVEVGRQFTEVGRRFDTVDQQITELRREMLGHFDEIYRRLDRLEQEYHAITQALRRIEAGLADESGRREILERDLATLKQLVTTLQSRIDDLEQRLGR